jgi:hypothetical protein
LSFWSGQKQIGSGIQSLAGYARTKTLAAWSKNSFRTLTKIESKDTFVGTSRMKVHLPLSLLIFILATVLCTSGGHAQQATADDKYAPLPDQIVGAKTAFLMNETGKAKFGDAVYKQIKTWNRWQVITDKNQADLVLVVTDKGGMKSVNPSFYLNVIDPKTGGVLWTSRTTMQGKLWRSWNSVAETLVADIRKRMPSQTLPPSVN